MIDPRHLLTLREISERGTVRGAAEALGYTSSAISQQMAALKSEVGVDLLARHGRGVRLTVAGRTLLAHADDVLEALEAARAAVAAHRDGVSGPVTVAAFPTAARHIVAPLLPRLHTTHPQLEVSLRTLETYDSLAALRAGAVDVAVAHDYSVLPSSDAPAFHRTMLLHEPMYLAVPAKDAASDAPMDLADLSDWNWVAGSPEGSCGQALRRACHAVGFEPRIRYESDDFAVALAIVAAGDAVTLIPRLGVSGSEAIAIRALSTNGPTRRVFATTRAGSQQSPPIDAVIAQLAEQVLQLRIDSSARLPTTTAGHPDATVIHSR